MRIPITKGPELLIEGEGSRQLKLPDYKGGTNSTKSFAMTTKSLFFTTLPPVLPKTLIEPFHLSSLSHTSPETTRNPLISSTIVPNTSEANATSLQLKNISFLEISEPPKNSAAENKSINLNIFKSGSPVDHRTNSKSKNNGSEQEKIDLPIHEEITKLFSSMAKTEYSTLSFAQTPRISGSQMTEKGKTTDTTGQTPIISHTTTRQIGYKNNEDIEGSNSTAKTVKKSFLHVSYGNNGTKATDIVVNGSVEMGRGGDDRRHLSKKLLQKQISIIYTSKVYPFNLFFVSED